MLTDLWKDANIFFLAEVESSHFLLQHVLSTTFDQTSEEYAQAVKDVNEAVKKGAQETTKITRAEAASRVYAVFIIVGMKADIVQSQKHLQLPSLKLSYPTFHSSLFDVPPRLHS